MFPSFRLGGRQDKRHRSFWTLDSTPCLVTGVFCCDCLAMNAGFGKSCCFSKATHHPTDNCPLPPVLDCQLGHPQHSRAHPNSCSFHSISVLVTSQLRTTANQKRSCLPYRIPPALEFYQTFNYHNAKRRYTMCYLAQCSNSSHTDLLIY